MARHRLPIVAVMGNNGIWALEHHPMKFLYGYSLAAELRPETRYDEVVSALGCHGELVRSPDELRPALDRAFASGKPALVNVLTDPEVVYPRSDPGVVHRHYSCAMTELAKARCEVCAPGTPPLPEEEAAKLSSEVPDWDRDGNRSLRREFSPRISGRRSASSRARP